MRSQAENFYRLNEGGDILEVCLILFKRCNLNCQFCFQDKSADIDFAYITSIPRKLKSPLSDIVAARGFKRITYRIWGGELFSDDIPDAVFDVYADLVNELRSLGDELGIRTDVCFTSNLVFEKTRRISDFLKKTDAVLATSYDPVYRFKSDDQRNTWIRNVGVLHPETVSITLTKQNIGEYVSNPFHFSVLNGQTVNIEYYIFNRMYDFFKPSQDDLFRFYVYCIDNKLMNIPEITAIVRSYGNPIGRYCTCDCSCLYIDGMLTFNCLRRSSNLPAEQFFDTLPREEEYTDIQLETALDRKNCLACRHYSYCRMFCMASVLHKSYDVSDCAMARTYEHIRENGIKW